MDSKQQDPFSQLQLLPPSPAKLTCASPRTLAHVQKNLLRALTENPRNHVAYCNLGSSLTQHGQIELPNGKVCSRQELFIKALEIEPLHAASYHNLGLTLRLHEYVSLSDHTKWNKSSLFQRAAELDPHNARALNDFAATLDRSSCIQLADGSYDVVGLYRKAISLLPTLAHAYANLGSILDAQEQVCLGEDIAWGKESLLLEAIRLDSKIAHAYNSLGLMIVVGSEAKVQLPNGMRCGKQELHTKAIELDACIPSAWRGLADSLENVQDCSGVCLSDGSMWTRRQLLAHALGLERRAWKAQDYLTKERWPLQTMDTHTTTFTRLEPTASRQQ